MVPVHETDVAEERWSKAEWEHYELWEKIEQRIRRRKWVWMVVTAAVFLALSSIPLLMERWPKWRALGLARRHAQEINEAKRDAALERMAYRVRFDRATGGLSFVVERALTCGEDAKFQRVRAGTLENPRASGLDEFSLYFGEPGLVDSYCYDPYGGSDPESRGEKAVGFAVGPVKDLAEKKTDRMAVVIVSGASGEVSFE